MKKSLFWLLAVAGIAVLAAGCSTTSGGIHEGTQGRAQAQSQSQAKDSWNNGGATGTGSAAAAAGESLGGGRGMIFVESGEMHRIYFPYDEAQLSQQSRETLRRNAEWLKSHPKVVIRVEGHADERGTEAYNLSLGERRALATRAFLISLGVDPSRIYTISYGKDRPLVLGHNEAAWAKNRRAEFTRETN